MIGGSAGGWHAALRILPLAVFMAATACMANNADNAWHGQYEYFVSGGKTVGGSQIMLDITLKVGRPGLSEICELELSGFQTYETILCTTAIDKNRLTLQFKSYPDGNIVNPVGVEEYKVGATLFSLEKSVVLDAKKQNQYLVHWGAFTPFGIERKNMKDYFEKIK